MSVRGEFQRILGDTTARLRVLGEARLAEALERAESSAGESLEARATAVLGVVEAEAKNALESALEHLREICEVVVGRRSSGDEAVDVE